MLISRFFILSLSVRSFFSMGSICAHLHLHFHTWVDHHVFILPEIEIWESQPYPSQLMNVGLLYTPVSIYQMTRGALVLFVGILSVIFLHRRLWLYQ